MSTGGRPSKGRPTKGRPAKEPDAVKSSMLSVRIRPELRSKLEQLASNGRHSLSEEVENRITESLADDDVRRDLPVLHKLLRSYLQTLDRRLGSLAEHKLRNHTAALSIGFELIALGAIGGSLPEERIKEFWLKDIAELSKQGSKYEFDNEGREESAKVAIDAFTTLTLAGLASVDPLALSQWFRDEAEKPD